MSNTEEAELRKKLWMIIEKIHNDKIFLHSKYIEIKVSESVYKFPVVIGLAILNAIVGNGSMLLYGGYGFGKTTFLKYLGRMITGLALEDIEASILRSNPQLTEEKIVARLHLGKLISEGEEEIIWRNFVKSFWKIIDEINRLAPNAQDAILSLLGEGIVKYFDAVYDIRKYVLYATLNPRDVGTFPLGMPLLDRFGIAVIVESPSLDDVIDIVDVPDDRIMKREIPSVLSIKDLTKIWGYVETMPVNEDARLFISMLIKEISSCVRANKETGIFLSLGPKLCAGCNFESLDTVCKMTLTPISIRAQKDLVRYSRALAWLLGLNEVTLEIVVLIAPYVIWHRLKYVEKYLDRKFYNKFELAKDIINTVLRNFLQRAPLMKFLNKIRRGEIEPRMVTAIKNAAQSDLVIRMDVMPYFDEIIQEKYLITAKRLVKAIENKDKSQIKSIIENAKSELSRYQFRSLMKIYESALRKNRKRIIVPFVEWKKNIELVCEKLGHTIIKRTLDPPRNVTINIGLDKIEIYTVDSYDEAPVFIITYSLWDEITEKIKKIFFSQ